MNLLNNLLRALLILSKNRILKTVLIPHVKILGLTFFRLVECWKGKRQSNRPRQLNQGWPGATISPGGGEVGLICVNINNQHGYTAHDYICRHSYSTTTTLLVTNTFYFYHKHWWVQAKTPGTLLSFSKIIVVKTSILHSCENYGCAQAT